MLSVVFVASQRSLNWYIRSLYAHWSTLHTAELPNLWTIAYLRCLSEQSASPFSQPWSTLHIYIAIFSEKGYSLKRCISNNSFNVYFAYRILNVIHLQTFISLHIHLKLSCSILCRKNFIRNNGLTSLFSSVQSVLTVCHKHDYNSSNIVLTIFWIDKLS